MNPESISGKEYDPWLFAAMTVSAAEAAARCSWIFTAAAGGLCLVLSYGSLQDSQPKWIDLLQWIGMGFLGASFLQTSYTCWQASGAEYAVPIVLILLAAISADKGAADASAACNVLRYGLYLVLGAVVLTTIKEADIKALYPKLSRCSPGLLTAMLLPAVGGRRPERKRGLYVLLIWAVFVSALTEAVIGKESSLYELSRSVSFGFVRIESITAGAVTVGNFILLTLLLSRGEQLRGSWWKAEGYPGKAMLALTMLILCTVVPELPETAIAVMTVLLWGVLPLGNKLAKNVKMVLDK